MQRFFFLKLGSTRGAQGSKTSVCWEVSLLVVFVLCDCCARDGLHKICENIVELDLISWYFHIFFKTKITAMEVVDYFHFDYITYIFQRGGNDHNLSKRVNRTNETYQKLQS